MSTERKLFEAWMRKEHPLVNLARKENGDYWPAVEYEWWDVWKARAAMAEQAATPVETQQKEHQIAELDTDSNDAGDRQQRLMVRALALGKLLGDRSNPGACNLRTQAEFNVVVQELARPIAEATAQNCSSVPQFTFPHIFLGLSKLFRSAATPPNVEKPALPEPDVVRLPGDDEGFSDDAPYLWAWMAHGYDTGMEPYFSVDTMKAHAKACIEADRAQRGGSHE